MIVKISKVYILAIACFLGFLGSDRVNARDQFAFSIEINSPPPDRPVVVERRWAPPSPNAVWVEPHYEWVHGGWVWIHGYYMFPPAPGYVWIPGHYEFHHHSHVWISGYWQEPAPVVVVQTPPPAPVVVQTPAPAPHAPPPYGSRIGTTDQIQSPYSPFSISSTSPRDTVIYDANTGQPFRIP